MILTQGYDLDFYLQGDNKMMYKFIRFWVDGDNGIMDRHFTDFTFGTRL